jgi:hypothetical protein
MLPEQDALPAGLRLSHDAVISARVGREAVTGAGCVAFTARDADHDNFADAPTTARSTAHQLHVGRSGLVPARHVLLVTFLAGTGVLVDLRFHMRAERRTELTKS